ncbi:TlpA disulfide reductase family protein [Corynebacterium sp. SCR221107]|uniref:TlpA family protein disulfide reductase n=1 Tax=Corynebacterium sp. SCR221107 TaxID=3017361 RepID=UPI0022EC571C|nr:TlpA disulfide reductase family protein [Corynebacterium sp. SCR221107]WBT09036.1 TlpA disulfide reductase family protein [Corynebacterium sp. SCR221107]
MPRKTVIASVIVFLLGIVLLLMLAPNLRNDSSTEEAATEESTALGTLEVPARPSCPAGEVAGIDLPCLGPASESDDTGDVAGASAGYTIVSLWAWWCEPCRVELPLFDELAAKHPEYEVVGVHADKFAANGAAMLNDLGVNIPSYQDDSNQFAGTLGLPGVVPITVIVDSQGAMVSFIPQAFEDYDSLEKAIAEKIAQA